MLSLALLRQDGVGKLLTTIKTTKIMAAFNNHGFTIMLLVIYEYLLLVVHSAVLSEVGFVQSSYWS